MVVVFSTKVVYEASGTACSLRSQDMSNGKGWEECALSTRTPLVQQETITSAAFESKYWRLEEKPLQVECPQ
jgi:hypothetical protein